MIWQSGIGKNSLVKSGAQLKGGQTWFMDYLDPNNGGKWYVFRYKAKDKGAGTKIKMGIKDITDIQKKLYQAGLELMNWIIRYRKQTALAEALMQSSPDKSA